MESNSFVTADVTYSTIRQEIRVFISATVAVQNMKVNK